MLAAPHKLQVIRHLPRQRYIPYRSLYPRREFACHRYGARMNSHRVEHGFGRTPHETADRDRDWRCREKANRADSKGSQQHGVEDEIRNGMCAGADQGQNTNAATLSCRQRYESIATCGIRVARSHARNPCPSKASRFRQRLTRNPA